LLQAAAARLLHLLTSPSSWKAAAGTEDVGRALQAAAGVLQRLQQQPVPLFKAAQRLLVLHHQQQRQQHDPNISGTGAPVQLGKEAGAASGVLGVCIKVLYKQPPGTGHHQHMVQQQTEGLGSISAASGSSSNDCLQQFVQEVLTLPGAVTLLAPGDQVSGAVSLSVLLTACICMFTVR
jgi:hypothetical protein